MGDWDDVRELLGLSPAAELDELERRIFDPPSGNSVNAQGYVRRAPQPLGQSGDRELCLHATPRALQPDDLRPPRDRPTGDRRLSRRLLQPAAVAIDDRQHQTRTVRNRLAGLPAKETINPSTEFGQAPD